MLLVLRLFRNDEFRQADRFCDTAVELWPDIPELFITIFLLLESNVHTLQFYALALEEKKLAGLLETLLVRIFLYLTYCNEMGLARFLKYLADCC